MVSGPTIYSTIKMMHGPINTKLTLFSLFPLKYEISQQKCLLTSQ